MIRPASHYMGADGGNEAILAGLIYAIVGLDHDEA
jgi:hypothetical protein